MAEKEYIERGAVLRHLFDQIEEHGDPDPIDSPVARGSLMGLKYAHSVVSVLPAADVVEVRHGKWIIKTDYKTPVSHAYIRKEKLYICPYCRKDYRQHMNFCGNCGAKMDGGEHV